MTPVSAFNKLKIMASLLWQVPGDFKYFGQWFCSLRPGHFPLRDERPWITFSAISWLEKYLRPEMRIFEYGSGGSTIFLARRAQEVCSVEHDEKYAQVVQAALKEKGLSNCTYWLEPPERVPEKSEQVEYSPESCTSFMHRWLDYDFSRYVTSIDRFEDGCFDLVLVDGRSRASCIFRALRKVKQGGCIVLDNSERDGYESARQLLSKYPRKDLFGLVPSNLELYQTTVWSLTDEPESRPIPGSQGGCGFPSNEKGAYSPGSEKVRRNIESPRI